MKIRTKKITKKAVLFSLISVLFSILFITMFSQNFSTRAEDKIPGSNVRIKVMDTYARNFETYLSDSIKISTYNMLKNLTAQKKNTKTFFKDYDDFNRTFYNCMMCGTTNCSNMLSITCGAGYYLNESIRNITTLSLQQMNILTTYAINSIDIEQNYPYEVDVIVNITYNVTDNSGGSYYAKWHKEKVITQGVTIIGLIDPMGYVNDNNTYTKAITQYTGICEFNESCWNYTTTQDFYLNDSFRYTKDGVSFLQRYWNDTKTSDCCGIETILHPDELSATVPASIGRNNSYIDHYYWNSSYSCPGGRKIINITLNGEEISLDEGTASKYGVTNTNMSKVLCIPP